MRTISSDIATMIGKDATVQGWLHKTRKMGGLNFINIRDRGGVVQVLIEDKDEVEKLRGLQIGTVLKVTGNVIEDERSPGGAEIHDPKIEVEVPIEDTPPIEIDKKIDHKPENLDTLFEHRVVSLRNLDETAVFRIANQITRSVRAFADENGFTEVNTPKLLAEATEGGAEVFKLDYFGKEATLAQSPQFYKEMLVGVFERVLEINPVYRAELSATTRHMSEYISIDCEMGFVELKDVLEFLSHLVNRVVDDVWSKYDKELKRLNANKPKLTDIFPTIPLPELHDKYEAATGETVADRDDAMPAEERWVSDWAKKEYGSEAIFITHFPASDMKFYHKLDLEDDKFADRADLIFRGVEIVTGSMREHRYDVLIDQLKAKGGDPENAGYHHFLAAMKAGMPPLGGFGLGLERLTQKIVGLNNVKEASLFPRDINRLAP